MKRANIFFFLLILASVYCVSCSSPSERLVKQFETAMRNGDEERAIKIAENIKGYGWEKLTLAEQKRVLSILEQAEKAKKLNYGSLGGPSSVIHAIEDYLPSPFYVEELIECKEINQRVLEYKCTVRIEATAPLHNGHGRLEQDASGRNIRGSFNFDD